jgi:hypothetical protein
MFIVHMCAWLVSWLPLSWRPKKILAMSRRAGEWQRVRREHLEKEPACQACGRTKELIVHHVTPVSFDPRQELNPDNLITLCGTPCHIVFGHFFSYHCYNKNVRKMVDEYRKAMNKRQCLKRFER